MNNDDIIDEILVESIKDSKLRNEIMSALKIGARGKKRVVKPRPPTKEELEKASGLIGITNDSKANCWINALLQLFIHINDGKFVEKHFKTTEKYLKSYYKKRGGKYTQRDIDLWINILEDIKKASNEIWKPRVTTAISLEDEGNDFYKNVRELVYPRVDLGNYGSSTTLTTMLLPMLSESKEMKNRIEFNMKNRIISLDTNTNFKEDIIESSSRYQPLTSTDSVERTLGDTISNAEKTSYSYNYTDFPKLTFTKIPKRAIFITGSTTSLGKHKGVRRGKRSYHSSLKEIKEVERVKFSNFKDLIEFNLDGLLINTDGSHFYTFAKINDLWYRFDDDKAVKLYEFENIKKNFKNNVVMMSFRNVSGGKSKELTFPTEEELKKINEKIKFLNRLGLYTVPNIIKLGDYTRTELEKFDHLIIGRKHKSPNFFPSLIIVDSINLLTEDFQLFVNKLNTKEIEFGSLPKRKLRGYLFFPFSKISDIRKMANFNKYITKFISKTRTTKGNKYRHTLCEHELGVAVGEQAPIKPKLKDMTNDEFSKYLVDENFKNKDLNEYVIRTIRGREQTIRVLGNYYENFNRIHKELQNTGNYVDSIILTQYIIDTQGGDKVGIRGFIEYYFEKVKLFTFDISEKADEKRRNDVKSLEEMGYNKFEGKNIQEADILLGNLHDKYGSVDPVVQNIESLKYRESFVGLMNKFGDMGDDRADAAATISDNLIRLNGDVVKTENSIIELLLQRIGKSRETGYRRFFYEQLLESYNGGHKSLNDELKILDNEFNQAERRLKKHLSQIDKSGDFTEDLGKKLAGLFIIKGADEAFNEITKDYQVEEKEFEDPEFDPQTFEEGEGEDDDDGESEALGEEEIEEEGEVKIPRMDVPLGYHGSVEDWLRFEGVKITEEIKVEIAKYLTDKENVKMRMYTYLMVRPDSPPKPMKYVIELFHYYEGNLPEGEYSELLIKLTHGSIVSHDGDIYELLREEKKEEEEEEEDDDDDDDEESLWERINREEKEKRKIEVESGSIYSSKGKLSEIMIKIVQNPESAKKPEFFFVKNLTSLLKKKK